MTNARKKKGPSAGTAEAFGENGSGAHHTEENINGDDAETNREDLSPHRPSIMEALTLLHGEGPWSIHAKANEGKFMGMQTPYEVAATDFAVKHNRDGCNIYIALATLREGYRGTKAADVDVASSQLLWADLDPKEKGVPFTEQRTKLLRLLTDNLPKELPPPSIIFDSGGGFWALWRLSSAIPPDVLRRKLKWIADLLGSDRTFDPSRIARLPGTVNWPTDDKRDRGQLPALAKIIRNDSVQYDPQLFGEAEASRKKQSNAESEAPPASGVDLDKVVPAIPEWLKQIIVLGHDPKDPKKYPSRSEPFWRVICELVRLGVADATILGIVLDRRFRISEHVLDQADPEKYARRQISRAHAEAEHTELGEMNSCHAVVIYGDHVRVMMEHDDGPPTFLTKTEFCDWYAHRTVVVGTKKGNDETESLGYWWFKQPQRRAYRRVEFLPGIEAPANVFNLYRGYPFQPKAGDCSKFLQLVFEVISAGDTAIAEYLLNWMALKLQHPELKLETSIALRGGQGVGKSVFAELYGSLFGRHFVKVTDRKGLMGNFNSHLQQALFVFADEMAAPTGADMMGRLKTMVTQKSIRIEPKGVNSFEAKNYFAAILASNNQHIVAADTDDRRWLVIDVSPCRRNDHAFFAELFAEWNSGGREALMAFLLARDLSTFEHRNRPRTAAHTEQVEHSFAGAERVIHEMLLSGETPPVQRIDRQYGCLSRGESVFVNATDAAAWARQRGWSARDAGSVEKSLGHLLRKLGGPKATKRTSVHGKQVRGTWLPKLADARKHWCEMQGRDFDWGEDEGACWDVVQTSAAANNGSETPI